jgi:hypothetical protein
MIAQSALSSAVVATRNGAVDIARVVVPRYALFIDRSCPAHISGDMTAPGL